MAIRRPLVLGAAGTTVELPAGDGLFPLFQGRATANQTLSTAGQWYPVALAAEDIDDDNGHSTTTNNSRWTAPSAMTVRVAAVAVVPSGQTVGGSGSTATNYRWAAIFKNGSPSYSTALPGIGFQYYNGQYLTVPTFPYIVTLAANDYLELCVASGLASSTIGGDANNGSLLSVERIR